MLASLTDEEAEASGSREEVRRAQKSPSRDWGGICSTNELRVYTRHTVRSKRAYRSQEF